MWDFLFKRGFVLPVSVAGIVPGLLALLTGALSEVSDAAVVAACPLLVAGLGLLLSTTRMFDRHGGSLAPWNPPARMVVVGVYRYVRNPMILGVFLLLAGETIALRSVAVGLWWLAFVASQHVHIVRTEEPALRTRFGDDYVRYCARVPRWFPRRPPPMAPVPHAETSASR